MYTYIVERTQIYLSKAQAAALDREAQRTGTTRSHLIREAIEARYGTARPDHDQVKRALRATAGLWRDRSETALEYVDQMRSGRRMREVEHLDDAAQPDAPGVTGPKR
jgi:metal-responsive CopG/Arc/MetJ family transcriptional regulator